LQLASGPTLKNLATIIMMAAAVAFTVQSIFVAASEAATGDTSHYYLGFVFAHPHDESHSHIIAHRHTDGTIHQHAIDDDEDALAKHIKEPGWNMALVICVLPCPEVPAISENAGHKLTIEKPHSLWVADLGGLRRPPRPPSIA
jgi:hypothetical protein